MKRLFLAFPFLIAGAGTAYAAECTKALHLRWEEAMTEAMQIHRTLLHLGAKEPDQQTLCRIVKSATELSKVGKDYFPACDPLDEDGRRVVLTRMEELLSRTDPSVCSKVEKVRSGRRT